MMKFVRPVARIGDILTSCQQLRRKMSWQSEALSFIVGSFVVILALLWSVARKFNQTKRIMKSKRHHVLLVIVGLHLRLLQQGHRPRGWRGRR